MERPDRLSALFDRFTLTMRPVPPTAASLVVLSDSFDEGRRVMFRSSGAGIDCGSGNCLFSAVVDWGGDANPLMMALPELVVHDLEQDQNGLMLVGLLKAELVAGRCGAGTAINRLCEVLVIRMLRASIEAGATEPGLIAGLADPRISRAIVAMHTHPERNWRNSDLSIEAGLSLSRFAELFPEKVGLTPAAYLRQWRLALARQDVARGERIELIARRYGYNSTVGFSRAFKNFFGVNPADIRANAKHSARKWDVLRRDQAINAIG